MRRNQSFILPLKKIDIFVCFFTMSGEVWLLFCNLKMISSNVKTILLTDLCSIMRICCNSCGMGMSESVIHSLLQYTKDIMIAHWQKFCEICRFVVINADAWSEGHLDRSKMVDKPPARRFWMWIICLCPCNAVVCFPQPHFLQRCRICWKRKVSKIHVRSNSFDMGHQILFKG